MKSVEAEMNSSASAGTVGRNEWNQANKCIVFPSDPAKEWWDIILLCLILYSSVSVPLRVCFSAEPEGTLFAFEAMMSAIFVMCEVAASVSIVPTLACVDPLIPIRLPAAHILLSRTAMWSSTSSPL